MSNVLDLQRLPELDVFGATDFFQTIEEVDGCSVCTHTCTKTTD
jgi:hypothetical protein